jgi:zinc transporter ZupT
VCNSSHPCCQLAPLAAVGSFFTGVAFCFLLDVLTHRVMHCLKDHGHYTFDTHSFDSLPAPGALASPSAASVAPPAADIEAPITIVEPASAIAAASPPLQAASGEVEERMHLVRVSAVTGLTLALHNLPEVHPRAGCRRAWLTSGPCLRAQGLMTFVSTLAEPELGIAMFVAVLLHNIPEGVCIAAPLLHGTGGRRRSGLSRLLTPHCAGSRSRAVFWTALSGLTEPLGALLGYAALFQHMNDGVFGAIFGAVAGAQRLAARAWFRS